MSLIRVNEINSIKDIDWTQQEICEPFFDNSEKKY